MLFPIAISVGDKKHAHGVEVPDLPGCFSAGDTLDEAITNAYEAIDLHLSAMSDDDEPLPVAKTVEYYRKKKEYAGRVWALVDIDITKYLGKAEKINVTLPGSLIRRIDEFVEKNPIYGSRSGFLAKVSAERLTSQ